MENTTAVKPKKIQKSLLKTFLFYTPVSFAYIAFVSVYVADNNKTVISEFASMLLKNLIILFAFSLIFGFSFLVFEAKKWPSSAKWICHIFILYASMATTILLMTGSSDNPSKTVLLIFISAMIFAVIYSFTALIVFLIKRKRR